MKKIDLNNSVDNIFTDDGFYITPLSYYFYKKNPDITATAKLNTDIFNKILFQKNNVLTVLVKGFRGSLKSALTRSLALSLINKFPDLNFTAENFCFSNTELKNKLEINKYNQIFIRDERNSIFGYNSISDNEILNSIIEAIRINRDYLFIINPYADYEFINYDLEIMTYKFNDNEFKFFFKDKISMFYDLAVIKRYKDEKIYADYEKKKIDYVDSKLKNKIDADINFDLISVIENIKNDINDLNINIQDIPIFVEKKIKDLRLNLTIHDLKYISNSIKFDIKYQNLENKLKSNNLTAYLTDETPENKNDIISNSKTDKPSILDDKNKANSLRPEKNKPEIKPETKPNLTSDPKPKTLTPDPKTLTPDNKAEIDYFNKAVKLINTPEFISYMSKIELDPENKLKYQADIKNFIKNHV